MIICKKTIVQPNTTKKKVFLLAFVSTGVFTWDYYYQMLNLGSGSVRYIPLSCFFIVSKISILFLMTLLGFIFSFSFSFMLFLYWNGYLSLRCTCYLYLYLYLCINYFCREMSYGLMTLPNPSNEKFSFKFPNPTFYNPKKKKILWSHIVYHV